MTYHIQQLKVEQMQDRRQDRQNYREEEQAAQHAIKAAFDQTARYTHEIR
jgi:hypothetical protein